MRSLFITNPLSQLRVDHDTGFAFMLEAQRRGHEVFHAAQRDLLLVANRAHAHCGAVRVQRVQDDSHQAGPRQLHSLNDFDLVFQRTDPPFDLHYLEATWILSLVDATKTKVINNPTGLREANEKLYALHFPEVIPETIVSSNIDDIRLFLKEMKGKAVLKPIDGFGGSGIFLISETDINLPTILETATTNETRRCMVQRFLPEAVEGDKRVLALNGEPMGAMLRIAPANALRNNIAAGGRAAPAEVTKRDREICELLAPRLRRDGLYFAGLDVIGGYLTEVNVTSPTCLVEIEEFNREPLAQRAFDFFEKL